MAVTEQVDVDFLRRGEVQTAISRGSDGWAIAGKPGILVKAGEALSAGDEVVCGVQEG